MRLASRLAPMALVALLTGCFHYVPVAEIPPQGTPVRAYLTRPISVDLTEVTANNIVQVRGEVVANRPDRLLMSAFALESVSQYEHLAAGETVLIPRDALGQIEEKRISATRTALAGAVLAGAGYLIQLGLRTAIGGGDGGEPPPPSK